MTFEEALNLHGRLVYTNVGFSMRPLIREGRDVMVIEKCDASALKKYDAVLFKRKNVRGRGEYVLHRIIKVLPDNKFWIVGDNCTDGETVDGEMILGVLTGLNRKNRAVDFNGIRYRLYVFFWCVLWRPRILFLKIRDHVRDLPRAIAHKFKKKGQ